MVPETWTARPEHEVSVRRLIRAIEPWLLKAEGVTISGGEPFEQPAALAALVGRVRSLCSGDVLVYSGYTWSLLQRRFAGILAEIDVLVSGPFVSRLPDTERRLCGSRNQQVHILTALAKRRYTADVVGRAFVNVAVDGAAIRLAGVLPKEVLVDIQQALKSAGFSGSLTHDAI
jgi:anaerobic ribonucleoside-triphosphate reductase activating protein